MGVEMVCGELDVQCAMQGRLTLLMGPPRSGKSLFMHMLAGKAPYTRPHTQCVSFYGLSKLSTTASALLIVNPGVTAVSSDCDAMRLTVHE